MATIRKRKNKDGSIAAHQWQAIVRMKNRATGLTHTESETFLTEREAKEWAKGIEADLQRAIHIDTRKIDRTPLKDLLHKYINEVSPAKLGGGREIVRLERWLRHPVADMMLSRITPKHFSDYIAERRKEKSVRGGKIKDQSIKLDIIAISNVFEAARKDWAFKLENPIRNISKPKGSGARDVRIVPAEWKKIEEELIQCRNPYYVLIAELAIETGMRQDEFLRMEWKDIDLSARKVEVWGKNTAMIGKRKKRVVPLSKRAVEILKLVQQQSGAENGLVFEGNAKVSADGLSRAFTAACRKLGLEGTVFHSTRHEAASRMAPHYPMLTLMAIFGWTTPAMAARYYHASDEELFAGLNSLERAKKSRSKPSMMQ